MQTDVEKEKSLMDVIEYGRQVQEQARLVQSQMARDGEAFEAKTRELSKPFHQRLKEQMDICKPISGQLNLDDEITQLIRDRLSTMGYEFTRLVTLEGARCSENTILNDEYDKIIFSINALIEKEASKRLEQLPEWKAALTKLAVLEQQNEDKIAEQEEEKKAAELRAESERLQQELNAIKIPTLDGRHLDDYSLAVRLFAARHNNIQSLVDNVNRQRIALSSLNTTSKRWERKLAATFQCNNTYELSEVSKMLTPTNHQNLVSRLQSLEQALINPQKYDSFRVQGILFREVPKVTLATAKETDNIRQIHEKMKRVQKLEQDSKSVSEEMKQKYHSKNDVRDEIIKLEHYCQNIKTNIIPGKENENQGLNETIDLLRKIHRKYKLYTLGFLSLTLLSGGMSVLSLTFVALPLWLSAVTMLLASISLIMTVYLMAKYYKQASNIHSVENNLINSNIAIEINRSDITKTENRIAILVRDISEIKETVKCSEAKRANLKIEIDTLTAEAKQIGMSSGDATPQYDPTMFRAASGETAPASTPASAPVF